MEGQRKTRLAGLARGRGSPPRLFPRPPGKPTPILAPMHAQRAEGLSLQAIADKLNAEGHTTRRGRPWNPMQVKCILDRSGVAIIAGNGNECQFNESVVRVFWGMGIEMGRKTITRSLGLSEHFAG